MKFFRALFVVLLLPNFTEAGGYDPLLVEKAEVVSKTFDIKDASRDRTIPVRVYLPVTPAPAPVIIFSHGLGGSRDNNPYLGNHWAGRGYVVVFVQHPGSDESVWKDLPALRRMAAMKKAASLSNFLDRGKDIPAVIDALEVWEDEPGHALRGRLDLTHIGMSGHSFGALTTQAVAGQATGRGEPVFLEKRIDAAVMMSPSLPTMGNAAKAFSTIEIPCLLMTGTRDDSPIGDGTAADRMMVFPNLKNAPAWHLVFDGATHMDFGQRKEAGQNRRYHKAILALSTAFWDAHLRGDGAAKQWLNGEGARQALEEKDVWERNARAE